MTAIATNSNDRTEMREALEALLGPVSEPILLAGGASKEAWAVDAGGERLLVRRAGLTVIHRHTLSLADEFALLEAAYEAGVKVPKPIRYIPDLEGREAFVMERLEGETIGRRIVRMSLPAELPQQLAEQLAKIHAIPAARVPFLGSARLERMVDELDELNEPHPAIELGLWWLRENRPPPRDPVVVHGDFRIGNVVVDEHGLVGVLDWEFAHIDEPARDLAFGLVRAWRFGVPEKRLGGIGNVEPYLERYNELTGFDIRPEELDYWELAGNVGWAIGCLTQAQRHLTGQDRSVEFAILGRLGVEVEYEICRLLEAA
ncbi:MAG TPA: phosphotransferase family protein [Gaiellaceae bacterium]|nr:phosphotransferase family protein [Gaiellaceae bacterium]